MFGSESENTKTLLDQRHGVISAIFPAQRHKLTSGKYMTSVIE
jgi:hypothetical protein